MEERRDVYRNGPSRNRSIGRTRQKADEFLRRKSSVSRSVKTIAEARDPVSHRRSLHVGAWLTGGADVARGVQPDAHRGVVSLDAPVRSGRLVVRDALTKMFAHDPGCFLRRRGDHHVVAVVEHLQLSHGVSPRPERACTRGRPLSNSSRRVGSQPSACRQLLACLQLL